LFAAFLGYNPVQHLVGPAVLSHLSSAQQGVLIGRSFFPGLIAGPFKAGLHAALDFAIVASLLAAAASWTRGSHVFTSPAAVGNRTVPVDPGASRPPNDEDAALDRQDRTEVASGPRR
jgi:hypothetical protein